MTRLPLQNSQLSFAVTINLQDKACEVEKILSPLDQVRESVRHGGHLRLDHFIDIFDGDLPSLALFGGDANCQLLFVLGDQVAGDNGSVQGKYRNRIESEGFKIDWIKNSSVASLRVSVNFGPS